MSKTYRRPKRAPRQPKPKPEKPAIGYAIDWSVDLGELYESEQLTEAEQDHFESLDDPDL